jgi:tetratricopeptide (TPR) repeat protein
MKNLPTNRPVTGAKRVELRAADLQRAMAHQQKGNVKEAEACYRSLLLVEPNDATVIRLLGLLHLYRGDFIAAIGLFERALRVNPDLVDAHVGLGNAFAAQGKLPAAEAAYNRALKLDSKNLEALNNLGNTLQRMRRFAEAASALRSGISINPKLAELHNNLGNALQAEKNLDEAVAAYREAILLKPDFAQAHNNLGNVLKARNDLPDAVTSYERALALNPRYVEALNNLGNTLHAQGRSAEALLSYGRSLQVKPDQGDAPFYESLVHLTLGDLAQGFAKYEHRWRSDLRSALRPFAQPQWLGDVDLKGKVLLLHAEQGLGDSLHFVRYAPLAAERGATVILEVQPVLKRLLRNVPGVQIVLAKGEPLPAFDLHCPLLSLPYAFRTTLFNIPSPASFLTIPPGQSDFWRDRLAMRPHPRVGLMWTGNPHHLNDRNRSLPLAQLHSLLDGRKGTFYSLQKEYRSDEERLAARQMGIIDLSAEIGDFESTAALVAQLDLVISVDTSMAHLAGSLDRPVWILLPFCPDWRWMLQRTDTPWYPSARLFRQERPADWSRPIRELTAALDSFPIS